MRKGILSLMSNRGKSGRRKTADAGKAEQTVEKKTVTAEKAEAENAPEKPFLQTIQIPKPGKAVKKKAKRKRGMTVVPQQDDKQS